MPIPPTYPGVYIEEIASGVRTIAGVPTSITAFIGAAKRGIENEPILVNNFGDFQREFGGLDRKSTMSYAVRDYYTNGGAQALIVRVTNGATYAQIVLPGNGGTLTLRASNKGAWGNNLRAAVDWKTKVNLPELFNLHVQEVVTEEGEEKIVSTETFLNVSTSNVDPRFLTRVLEKESSLVRVDTWTGGPVRPAETWEVDSLPSVPGELKLLWVKATPDSGKDGNDLGDADFVDGTHENDKTGLYALLKADIFNILCIPPPKRGDSESTSATIYSKAAAFCRQKRAMLIVDTPPDWDANPNTAVATAKANKGNLGPAGLDMRNAALYFPRLVEPDPLNENQLTKFPACGAVAGIYASTDAQRGVWKAPAGIEAGLNGVTALTVKLTDPENGVLNPEGINALRHFPVSGRVVWGARTMRGADLLADDWKYVPVRRLALYIEESLYRGTQWVVFEPNDEPLWAQIRLNVGSFMHNLFRQGAFQGKTPRDAYLVKCDKETTTQADINAGIVNVLIGFAPLKPAEFVYIKIQQLAGQIQT
jgi:phage tail sheath protein FI